MAPTSKISRNPKPPKTKHLENPSNDLSYQVAYQAIQTGEWINWTEEKKLKSLQLHLRDNEARRPILFLAIETFPLNLLPKEIFTLKTLSQRFKKEKDIALHIIAIQGKLKDLPKDILTKESLQLKGRSDWTILHCAAANKHIHHIPPELLTEEALNQEDFEGHTTLHYVAYTGQLHLLSKKNLTEAALLHSSRPNQETPLDWAELFGHIHQLPSGILSRKTLQRLLKTKTLNPKDQTWVQKELLRKNLVQIQNLQKKTKAHDEIKTL